MRSSTKILFLLPSLLFLNWLFLDIAVAKVRRPWQSQKKSKTELPPNLHSPYTIHCFLLKPCRKTSLILPSNPARLLNLLPPPHHHLPQLHLPQLPHNLPLPNKRQPHSLRALPTTPPRYTTRLYPPPPPTPPTSRNPSSAPPSARGSPPSELILKRPVLPPTPRHTGHFDLGPGAGRRAPRRRGAQAAGRSAEGAAHPSPARAARP